LIEEDIDHEAVDSSVVTSSGPSEYPYADYDLLVIHTESFSSESSEFRAMIQQVISSIFLTNCLEFVSESNIPPLAGLDVRPPRHLTYLFSIVRSYA